jgi:hypothetical protein
MDTVYTSGASNWTCPPGARRVRVMCWAGGGGGGGQNQNSDGGGGGGGGAMATSMIAVTPASTYAYSVGAGGQATPARQAAPGAIRPGRPMSSLPRAAKAASHRRARPRMAGWRDWQPTARATRRSMADTVLRAVTILLASAALVARAPGWLRPATAPHRRRPTRRIFPMAPSRLDQELAEMGAPPGLTEGREWRLAAAVGDPARGVP